MRSCIRRDHYEKYELSVEEVKEWFVEHCANHEGEEQREMCAVRAETHLAGRANQPPFGLRAQIKDKFKGGYQRVVRTGRAFVRGAKRTTGRAWSWAKSKFKGPSAFQTSAVREKEAAGAMHPLRPILVGE
ncbi:MAG: hypothetical protein M1826_003280 [Phylliscum demangeonii]|nr:MAG: hypothetical protein M1826_003280 [Phylliscum demangeonii]